MYHDDKVSKCHHSEGNVGKIANANWLETLDVVSIKGHVNINFLCTINATNHSEAVLYSYIKLVQEVFFKCLTLVLCKCWITKIYIFFLVFDDEDENKLSYTDIHVQYKKLVSTIFGPDVSTHVN